VTQPLVATIQQNPSQPSTVRIGVVESVSPLVVNVQGSLFVGVGYLGWYTPVVGDVVGMVGQSALTSDAASWLCVGEINPADFVPAAAFVAPQGKAWGSGVTNMLNNTATVIPLATQIWDNANMWDGAQPSRLTAPIDGRYLILANVGFDANAVGRRICQIRANGATMVTEQATNTAATGTAVIHAASEYDLLAGQYVEMLGLQTSGGALNSTAVIHQTWMSMRWMSNIS
jgi:hypothetical protein